MVNLYRKTVQDHGFFTWIYHSDGPGCGFISGPNDAVIGRLVNIVLNLQTEWRVIRLRSSAFSFFHIVHASGRHFVVQASSGLLQKWKTENEVSTLKWVEEHTSLPVPKVLAWNSYSHNDLGFEWILMETSHSNVLCNVWQGINFPAKQDLVRQIAMFYAQVFRRQVSGIGSLYKDKSTSPGFAFGPNVSPYFMTKAQGYELTKLKGPFDSARAWVMTQMDFTEIDLHFRLEIAQQNYKENAKIDNSLEDPKNVETYLVVLARLRRHIDDFFPENDSGNERFIMAPPCLSSHDILVDDAGRLSSVMNWECVSTEPMFTACRLPEFLQEPQICRPEEKDWCRDGDGNLPDKYWERLADFERKELDIMALRDFFLDEMRKLEPAWLEAYEAGRQKRNFLKSVVSCSNISVCPPGCRCLDGLGPDSKNFVEIEDATEEKVFIPLDSPWRV